MLVTNLKIINILRCVLQKWEFSWVIGRNISATMEAGEEGVGWKVE
jgi:hypothetical protein